MIESEMIGKGIKKALKEKRISQEELALAIGKNQAQLSKYISGKHQMGAEILIKIAKFLNISLDQLVGYQTSKKESILEEQRVEYMPLDKRMLKLEKEISALKIEVNILKKCIN